MAMNFWEAQRKARTRSFRYIVLFVLLTAAIAFGAEWALRWFDPEDYQPSIPYIGLIFVIITVVVASFNYGMYSTYGGSYVAESVNGRLIHPDTQNPKERQILNIVEEMALAASVAVPKVYIIPAKQINAFAAGISQEKAALAISVGAIERLNRDELQGVIGHEIGHIYNRDMRISMMLTAMIAGFFVIMYLGFRVLQFSPMQDRRSGDGDRKGGPPLVIVALILIAAGVISWIAGKILASSVSREREYLADACSVQFTRNPSGIMGALMKIQSDEVVDMPSQGMAFEQLYFNESSFFSSLFATHPPLDKRIAAIRGGTYAFDPKDRPIDDSIDPKDKTA